MSVAVESQTVLAFDSLAAKYDDLFTPLHDRTAHSVEFVGRLDRHLRTRCPHSGSQLRYRRRCACFWREMMFPFLACDCLGADDRTPLGGGMQSEDPEAPIEFRVLPTEHLSKLGRGELFDGSILQFFGV